MAEKKMPTGKSLGFKKGDFVSTGSFPAIIVMDVQTYAPTCETWGTYHETGSAYATDLRHLTYKEFVKLATAYGYDGTAYCQAAKDAIKAAKLAADIAISMSKQ